MSPLLKSPLHLTELLPEVAVPECQSCITFFRCKEKVVGIPEHQEMVKNWVSLTSSMMSFVTPVMTVINCLVSVTVSVWQMGHGVAVCQHVHVRIKKRKIYSIFIGQICMSI